MNTPLPKPLPDLEDGANRYKKRRGTAVATVLILICLQAVTFARAQWADGLPGGGGSLPGLGSSNGGGLGDLGPGGWGPGGDIGGLPDLDGPLEGLPGEPDGDPQEQPPEDIGGVTPPRFTPNQPVPELTCSALPIGHDGPVRTETASGASGHDLAMGMATQDAIRDAGMAHWLWDKHGLADAGPVIETVGIPPVLNGVDDCPSGRRTMGCYALLSRAMSDPLQAAHGTDDARVSGGIADWIRWKKDGHEFVPADAEPIKPRDIDAWASRYPRAAMFTTPSDVLETTAELVGRIDYLLAQGNHAQADALLTLLAEVNPSAAAAIRCLVPSLYFFPEDQMPSGPRDAVGPLSGVVYERASDRTRGSLLAPAFGGFLTAKLVAAAGAVVLSVGAAVVVVGVVAAAGYYAYDQGLDVQELLTSAVVGAVGALSMGPGGPDPDYDTEYALQNIKNDIGMCVGSILTKEACARPPTVNIPQSGADPATTVPDAPPSSGGTQGDGDPPPRAGGDDTSGAGNDDPPAAQDGGDTNSGCQGSDCNDGEGDVIDDGEFSDIGMDEDDMEAFPPPEHWLPGAEEDERIAEEEERRRRFQNFMEELSVIRVTHTAEAYGSSSPSCDGMLLPSLGRDDLWTTYTSEHYTSLARRSQPVDIGEFGWEQELFGDLKDAPPRSECFARDPAR